VEQLTQKRLPLLLHKCFASLWPLTRVLSNLWSTQHRGGLITLNYIPQRQQRWEEQRLSHRGADPQLVRGSKSEAPGEKAKSNLGKRQARSWRHEQHPRGHRAGRKHNPGLGRAWVCTHAGALGGLRLTPAVAPGLSAQPPSTTWRFTVICLSKGMLLFDHFQLRCE